MLYYHMGGLFQKECYFRLHLDSLKSLTGLNSKFNMMVTHPNTLSQVGVLKHLIEIRLRLNELMTKILGDMSLTHG